MKHDLGVLLVWACTVFLAWKLGAASELMRLRDEILEGRESQTESGRALGASRPSRVYDGEAEAALYPGPLLTVVDELEVEPPRLRVVDP